MNSTSPRPAPTMRLTAFPPPPPTPITLMRQPFRTTSSSRRIRSFSAGITWRASMSCASFRNARRAVAPGTRSSEKLLEQRAQPSRETAERADADPHRLGLHVAMRVQHEADRRRERRAVDVIRQPPDALGRRTPYGQIENLLGDFGHAFEQRGPAREDDAGVERLLVAGAPDLVPQQVTDLLRARLQDLRQHAARHHPRASPGDARHFHGLVLGYERRQRAAR